MLTNKIYIFSRDGMTHEPQYSPQKGDCTRLSMPWRLQDTLAPVSAYQLLMVFFWQQRGETLTSSSTRSLTQKKYTNFMSKQYNLDHFCFYHSRLVIVSTASNYFDIHSFYAPAIRRSASVCPLSKFGVRSITFERLHQFNSNLVC